MQTIAVTNHKGGVGKSGVTCCLAGALADLEQRILIVDLDQQATATEWLGVSPPGELAERERHGVALREILADGNSIAPLALRTDSGVDVVPCGTGFAAFDRAVADQIATERLLARSLALLPSRWDYILLDCPPSLGTVTVNALVAADTMLVPVEPKSASRTPILTLLKAAHDIRELLNPRLGLLGIVASRFQPRVQHRQVEQWLRESFGAQVFQTVVRENTHVSESHAFQKTITQYMPKSNGASDFRALAHEFLERMPDLPAGERKEAANG